MATPSHKRAEICRLELVNHGRTANSIATTEVESALRWMSSSPCLFTVVVPTSRQGLQQDGMGRGWQKRCGWRMDTVSGPGLSFEAQWDAGPLAVVTSWKDLLQVFISASSCLPFFSLWKAQGRAGSMAGDLCSERHRTLSSEGFQAWLDALLSLSWNS